MRVPRFARVSSVAHDGSIMSIETIWLAIGFLGQGLFFGRWVIQWIASERKAESQVPISFWYMSLIGGLITLAYAISAGSSRWPMRSIEEIPSSSQDRASGL